MDFTTYISRNVYRRFAAEREISVRTAVFIGSALGLCVCFVALVVTRILGL